MPYPHRYTTTEKVLETEYTLGEVHGAGVKHDFASYLLFELRKSRKSLEKTRESRALRKRPLYMGVVLVLTRLVYYALDRIQDLTPPLEVPKTIQARQRPSKQGKEMEQFMREHKSLANERKRQRE